MSISRPLQTDPTLTLERSPTGTPTVRERGSTTGDETYGPVEVGGIHTEESLPVPGCPGLGRSVSPVFRVGP